jgi:hypothetical protein
MTDSRIDRLREMIPRYWRGELDQDEAAIFREGLKLFPELRTEAEELRQLAIGLEIVDRLAAEHPDSADLVAFIYHPEELDHVQRRGIEEHLRQCEDCRNEYNLATEAEVASRPVLSPAQAVGASLPERLWHILFPARFVLQPAVAYLVILLLALPTYLGVRTLVQTRPSAISIEVHESGTRSGDDADKITISRKSDVINLQLPSFPARIGYRYNLLLEDSLGRVVSAWYDVTINRSDGFDVPASRLSENTYRLEFQEVSPVGDFTGSFAPRVLKIVHTE